MNLTNRLAKLEGVYARDAGGPAGVTRSLKGASWREVLEAVEGAVPGAAEDVLRSVLAHVEAAAQRPLHDPPMSRDNEFWYEGCNDEKATHHFVYWLLGL